MPPMIFPSLDHTDRVIQDSSQARSVRRSPTPSCVSHFFPPSPRAHVCVRVGRRRRARCLRRRRRCLASRWPSRCGSADEVSPVTATEALQAKQKVHRKSNHSAPRPSILTRRSRRLRARRVGQACGNRNDRLRLQSRDYSGPKSGF